MLNKCSKKVNLAWIQLQLLKALITCKNSAFLHHTSLKLLSFPRSDFLLLLHTIPLKKTHISTLSKRNPSNFEFYRTFNWSVWLEY